MGLVLLSRVHFLLMDGWLAFGVCVWLGVGAEHQHRCMLCLLGLPSGTHANSYVLG